MELGNEVDELIEKVSKIAKKNKSSSIKISKNEKQRLKFWAGRKAAFPACGDFSARLLLYGWKHSKKQTC